MAGTGITIQRMEKTSERFAEKVAQVMREPTVAAVAKHVGLIDVEVHLNVAHFNKVSQARGYGTIDVPGAVAIALSHRNTIGFFEAPMSDYVKSSGEYRMKHVALHELGHKIDKNGISKLAAHREALIEDLDAIKDKPWVRNKWNYWTTPVESFAEAAAVLLFEKSMRPGEELPRSLAEYKKYFPKTHAAVAKVLKKRKLI